jgi:hypothetical protein
MVQQRELLWECSNDYDTEVTYKKGTTKASANQGVCAGLSIEFCKNILKGTRPELSKPFLTQGMIYQRFYDWGTDDASRNAKMFSTAEVNSDGGHKSASQAAGATYIWGKQAVFWGGWDCHACAVAKVGANRPFLFFDPNFGCYAVHSELRLAELFEQGRNAVDAAAWIEFYTITLP